jgi:cytochrome P450
MPVTAPKVDFADPHVQACPFPYYDLLREQAPAYYDERMRMFIVTGYDDVKAIMLDHARIGDVLIPADAIVNARWGAANPDPRKFANSAELDICRLNAQQGLAFGTGIRTCVGRQLARAELRIALQQLLQRGTNIRYARGDRASSWQRVNFVTWGAGKLYVELERRQAGHE